MRYVARMTTEPNITAKITFSGNNAQFKSNGILFMAEHTGRTYNGQVTENGKAIDPNLYLALVFSGDKQRPVRLTNQKLRNKKVCCNG